MDQTNPLSGLAHKRRLSAMGPGGLSRERAGFEVRDVHPSHYGRMCPIETPEGPNIGLIGHLAAYGRINDYGFIETPYRKVADGRVTDEIVYLAADEEEEYVIAQANAALDDPEPLHGGPRPGPPRPAGHRACRAAPTARAARSTTCRRPRSTSWTSRPKQIVSIPTALIPFIEHDDANRALMGANMQKQAVPLVRPEAPYIGTGVEARAARDAGDVLLAEATGIVTDVTGDSVTVQYDPGQRNRFGRSSAARSTGWPSSTGPTRTPASTRRSRSTIGDKVVGGQLATVLADGPSTDEGELGLGKNLLVAFMPWEGYNFEDAIILSERLVKDDVLTSIHIQQHEVDARDTKLGAEEITRDIPNLSEEILKDLDERGHHPHRCRGRRPATSWSARSPPRARPS